MAFGFGVLQLSPTAFWLMTPLELAAAARGLTGDGAGLSPPDAQDLVGLMEMYPDG